MARQQRGGRGNGGEKKEYDNTNRGSLWVTEQFLDGSNSKAPVLRGTLDVEGVTYNISFWLNNDLKDFEEDLAGLLGEAVDEVGKKPVLRGSIQVKEDKPQSGGGSRRGGSSRSSGRKQDAEERDEDDSWA